MKEEKQTKVVLTKTPPQSIETRLKDVQDEASYFKRSTEQGTVHPSGASVITKKDGRITLSASRYGKYTIGKNGNVEELSISSTCITNRRTLTCNEIVINKHKLNPLIYELTDFKKVDLDSSKGHMIGNFTVTGSVLVKAWDTHLGRYMMIRRPCRMPLFGYELNVPEIHEGLDIFDPWDTRSAEEFKAYNEYEGYLVNEAIKDSASLIGKKARRKEDETMPYQYDSVGDGENVSAKTIYRTLKNHGYNDMAIAAIMGNMWQESRFSTKDYPVDSNGYGGLGLVQWTNDRRDAMIDFARERGLAPTDPDAQLAFVLKEVDNTHSVASPSRMNSQPTLEDASELWRNHFEVGEDPQPRIRYAREYYEKIKSGAYNE